MLQQRKSRDSAAQDDPPIRSHSVIITHPNAADLTHPQGSPAARRDSPLIEDGRVYDVPALLLRDRPSPIPHRSPPTKRPSPTVYENPLLAVLAPDAPVMYCPASPSSMLTGRSPVMSRATSAAVQACKMHARWRISLW